MTVSVEWAMGVPFASISKETRLPSAFTARYTPDSGPAVELAVTIEGGSPVCQEIRVLRDPGGPSLTGTEIRRVPIVDVIEHACRQVAVRFVEQFPDGSTAWEPTFDDEPARRTVARDVTTARQRRHVTDDLLRDVARVYRANRDSSPTASVQETFTVSRATATRWIKLARERGFLGKAIKGKAGEQ